MQLSPIALLKHSMVISNAVRCPIKFRLPSASPIQAQSPDLAMQNERVFARPLSIILSAITSTSLS